MTWMKRKFVFFRVYYFDGYWSIVLDYTLWPIYTYNTMNCTKLKTISCLCGYVDQSVCMLNSTNNQLCTSCRQVALKSSLIILYSNIKISFRCKNWMRKPMYEIQHLFGFETKLIMDNCFGFVYKIDNKNIVFFMFQLRHSVLT